MSDTSRAIVSKEGGGSQIGNPTLLSVIPVAQLRFRFTSSATDKKRDPGSSQGSPVNCGIRTLSQDQVFQLLPALLCCAATSYHRYLGLEGSLADYHLGLQLVDDRVVRCSLGRLRLVDVPC